MKRTAYFLATVLICISILIGCSKDQKVVKQLDGKWKVTGMTVNGADQPASAYDNVEYQFNSCKLKKGDCDGTVTEASFMLPFTYNISDKGTKMTMKFNFLGTNFTETMDIKEHSKSKFVMSQEENGKTTVTTMEKI
jgi:hypothetical protein